MSVEGLLSEVKHFNAHNLEAALGEQLLFGGKRIFSDVKPGSSKDQNKNTKNAAPANSELKGAIDNAKNTAKQALNKGGNSSEISSLQASHDALTKKVESLATLVAELQLELSSLRQGKVKRQCLILGDGNLSFSLEIALSNPETIYYATVFDSRTDFFKKYDAQNTVSEIESLNNVVLIFGVDATNLPLCWANKFSDVIMNFPHQGGKSNLKKSRCLLLGIFESLRSIMDYNSRFLLRLAIGQSGIVKVDEPWGDELPSHEKDSWQAIYLAAEAGFVLDTVENFEPEQYKLYRSSGYKETKKGFNTQKGLTLIFKRCDTMENNLKDFKNAEKREKAALFHYYRPFYIQDLSFLYKIDEESGEKMALEVVKELAGNCLAQVSEVEALRSMCPEPYLPNRIYRLIWQGVNFPMGRNMCARVHEELRFQIAERIRLDNLPFILT